MRRLDFDDFDRRYKIGKRSGQTARYLQAHNDAQVSHTLRAHWEDSIDEWKDVKVRDRLDDLLEAIGMLEIASFLRVAPDLPDEFRKNVRTILGNPNVRRFSEKLYPIVLPQLLRDRLEGQLPAAYSRARPGDNVNAEAVFIALFDLDIRRNKDEPLCAFLGLLDGYPDHGWYLPKALSKLRSHKAVAAALRAEARKKPSAEPSRIMRLLLGLDSFLTYGKDLLTLLERNEGTVTASLAWLHHSYFYGGSADSSRRSLKSVIGLLRRFADPQNAEEVAFAKARADEMLGVFKALQDRERWVEPARAVGLGPYLKTLDENPHA